MMRYSRRNDFEPVCSSGGDYHACDSTRFVGCCTIDPCASGSCDDDHLKSMSFDSHLYSTAFKDQACSIGGWYTCNSTNPPFVGCCKSNPCATKSGCPAGDLVEGSLSSNSYDAAPWLSAATLDAATTTSSVAPVSSLSDATTASSGHKMLSGGAIAGVAVSIGTLVVLLIAAFLLYRRRKAAATESRGFETKNLVEAPSTGIFTAASQGDSASAVHEAAGMDGVPKGFRNSAYPGNSPLDDPFENHVVLTRRAGSSYSSPTPAYSPHQLQNPHSPPQYYSVSELETPVPTFQNVQNDPRQSAELPSANTPSPFHQHNVRSTAPVDSLGISQAFKQSPSPLSHSGHYKAYSREAHMRGDGGAQGNGG